MLLTTLKYYHWDCFTMKKQRHRKLRNHPFSTKLVGVKAKIFNSGYLVTDCTFNLCTAFSVYIGLLFGMCIVMISFFPCVLSVCVFLLVSVTML